MRGPLQPVEPLSAPGAQRVLSPSSRFACFALLIVAHFARFCKPQQSVRAGRHVRTARTHTGKFSAGSVRAALRRVHGSAGNFVPRGILGGRNFCRAAARRNGFPLKRVVSRHALYGVSRLGPRNRNMHSLMLRPTSSMVSRSMPRPKPPWGGQPYWKNSR